ncbi:hypothetical protein QMP26_41750 (plasmid) [Enterocloster clostridioformis]
MIGLNSEIMHLRLIEGPIADNRNKEAIHAEVIRMLRKTYKMDTGIAEIVYNYRISGFPCHLAEYGKMYLDIWDKGASLIYNGGYEDLIEIVSYDENNKVDNLNKHDIIIDKKHEEDNMEIGWVTAVIKGSNIDSAHDEDFILLPVEHMQITDYLRRHSDAEISDLNDNKKCFPSVMQMHNSSILDFISQDCTLEELNLFLWTASLMTEEQFEAGICMLQEVKRQRPGGRLNTEDMLTQVARWEETQYCPLSEKQFIRAVGLVLPGTTQRALEMWITFAKECVEHDQYVDFKPVSDKKIAVGRWLETLLVGFYQCKIQYGVGAAAQVCSLGQMDKPMCLYPGEMGQAAERFTKGESADRIAEMIQNDELEAVSPFFPKLKDYESLSGEIDLNEMG